MFEVPQRKQLASGGTPLSLFAPASSPACVPGTCAVNASPLLCRFAKFGTGEGPLVYGICIRCKKRAPVYARRFQRHSVQKTGIYGTEGKFGAKKRLLVYGGDIRYRREPSSAPDAASKAQNRLLWYATRLSRLFSHPLLDMVCSLRYGQSDRKGNYHQEQQHADPDGC